MTAAGQTSGSRFSRRPLGPIGARTALIATALAALLLIPAAAAAEGPPLLWKRGENCTKAQECDWGTTNGGADIETQIPRGIATDPNTGNVYLADQGNSRIVEFTAWGLFVKAWGWGVKDGSPELQSCGPGATPPTPDCKAGLEGSGAGEFNEGVEGMAVDSAGNVYVVDHNNFRVQKFDSGGHFLLMFGGEVDKGPNHPGNLCTAQFIAEGDTCGAGTAGAGNGQFSAEWPFTSYIAIGPADQVYVGDESRIQRFSAAGVYESQIALPGVTVSALATDPAGNLYAAFSGKENVLKMNSAGTTLCTGTVANPTAVAAGPGGNFYVVDDPSGFGPKSAEPRVLEFDSSCKRTEVPAFGQDELTASTGIATGSACFSEGAGLYVSNWAQANSFIRAYGIPDNTALCPPPPAPPTIAAQYAISVGSEEATLGAQINPHFWPDTTYFMRYGTAACVEAGWEAECVKEQPSAPAKLNSGVIGVPAPTNGIFLSGLEPGTEYRYRFSAQSGGGGPVQGAERSFETFRVPQAPNTSCPNQAFRSGAGATLPDCRAYEMVSPLDKEGGDVAVRTDPSTVAYPARFDQSATSGEAFTYSSYRAFGGASSAAYSTQYMAHRDGGGWQNEPISPPKEGDFFRAPGAGLIQAQTQSPFKAFTADLSQGWVSTFSEPVLAPGGQPGYANLYRRESAGGAYGACTTAEPHVADVEKLEPTLQGISADGRIGVFRANDALTADANPPAKAGESTNAQLYECREGEVRLLSVLPNGTASKIDSNAGVLNSAEPWVDATLHNAVSADGERVFWTAGGSGGKIYARVGGEETITVSSADAKYWTAARDGSKAIYTTGTGTLPPTGTDLFEFNLEGKTTVKIASKVLGVAAASEDASRVYFATRRDLGGGASEGDVNLYLYEAGKEGGKPTYAFVGALAESDAFPPDGALVLTPLHPWPTLHAAQADPDGAHLVFMAESPELADSVAGYDNADQTSGRPDREVYRYAADSGDLACISCNPSGARPLGRFDRAQFANELSARDAARIPAAENGMYAPRVLSSDGTRVYFESFEALVLSDTNGRADVYQWEQAGVGDCKAGDATYVKASGGCLSLISSGKSPGDSELADVSADGSNVFIRTDSSLVSQDPGSIDLYDARIDGGFPPPPSPAPECEGTSCQNPPGAPNDPTPASAAFHGPGDPSARKPKPRCAKRKAKAKKANASRCAKKHKHKHKHKRANHKRRASR